FYEAPWFAMVVRSVVALLAVLLVLLMGVRPLIRALKREPGSAPLADDAADGEVAARPAVNPATGQVDAALLGRQVGLAQRIVAEKPDEALDALRTMLGQPKPEAAQ
ncbi:MAG: flagellar M-ring protein FliF, partial [Novosphingobium sp.]|nr:flagellar M-ring protein FliF [Novosphingobium sp.]